MEHISTISFFFPSFSLKYLITSHTHPLARHPLARCAWPWLKLHSSSWSCCRASQLVLSHSLRTQGTSCCQPCGKSQYCQRWTCHPQPTIHQDPLYLAMADLWAAWGLAVRETDWGKWPTGETTPGTRNGRISPHSCSGLLAPSSWCLPWYQCVWIPWCKSQFPRGEKWVLYILSPSPISNITR